MNNTSNFAYIDNTDWGTDQAYGLHYSYQGAELWPLKLNDNLGSILNVMQKEELTLLLNSFQEVFAEPQFLPPQRSCDHSITLQQGSNPVNLKAYKCGPLQKNVIEKMVQEMLDAGVIRPSHSDFASPAVLVKKKGWKLEILCRL